MFSERRVHRRIEVAIPAKLIPSGADKANEATVLNLSEGGAFLQTNATIKRGEILQVKISFDEKSPEWEAQAKVIYHSDDMSYDPKEVKIVQGMESWIKNLGVHGVGIQFLELSEEKREQLRSLIHTIEW